MTAEKVSMKVRTPAEGTAIIDISGEVSGFAENELMDAYTEANS